MLTGGAYSSKFKALEKERLNKLRNVNQVVQVTVQDRARSLSLETNRRRRALELKKKLESEKEAKRRHDILEDRKQRQNEATQKYQRLKSATRRKTEDKVRGVLYGSGKQYDSGLHSQLPNTSTLNYGASIQGAPGLDEALKVVRGYQGTSLHPYVQSQSSTPSNYTYYQTTSHNQLDNGYSQHATSSQYSPMSVSGRGVNYNGFTTSATPCNTNVPPPESNHAGSQTWSLYEKQIEDQQRGIVEESHRSLLEFNEAVLNEAEASLRRSSSCSSVDSLEWQSNKVPVSKANSTSALPSSQQTTTFTQYRNGVSVSGAPSTSQRLYQTTFNHNAFVAKEHSISNCQSVIPNKHSSDGEIKIEETGVADIVETQLEAKSKLIDTSATNNIPPSFSSASGAKPYTTRTTVGVAWASPQIPTDTEQSSVIGTRSRPFSAKTTATMFTVEPASSYMYTADAGVGSPNTVVARTEHMGNASTAGASTPQTKVISDNSQTRNLANFKQTNAESTTTTPKSILKKGNVNAENSTTTSQRYGSYTMSRLGGAKVKDSLERLRKVSSMSDISPSKKGIRWADLEYKDTVSDDNTCCNAQNGRIHIADANKSTDLVDSSLRPQSAKVYGHGRVNVPARVSSAGSAQRTATSRPKSTVNKQPCGVPIGGVEAGHELNRNNVNATKSTSNGNAVYGPNGIRLDRTPTDDEINWLWDKVRTCLNVRDEHGSVPVASTSQKPPSGKQPSLNSQYVDGKRPGSNTRLKPSPPSASGHTFNGTYPRRRTSSDTASSFLRRTALLQQRRQHSAISSLRGPRVSNQNEPVNSAEGPSFTTTEKPGYSDEVSDSLMMFQKAELMAQEDMSETEIAAAVERPQKPTRPEMKGPSALSMEEQRLLESLDRLNERLRLTSEATSNLTTTYAPLNQKISMNGGGFRGHRPLSSTVRVAIDYTNRQPRARTHSADRASGRMNSRY